MMGLEKLPFRILILPIAAVFLSFILGIGGKVSGIFASAWPALIIGFGFSGIMILAGAVYTFRHAKWIKRHYLSAFAVITGNREQLGSGNQRPRVSFIHEGKQYHTTLKSTRSTRYPFKGDQIRILYDPKDPQIAYEAAFHQIYGIPVALTLLGLVFELVAISKMV